MVEKKNKQQSSPWTQPKHSYRHSHSSQIQQTTPHIVNPMSPTMRKNYIKDRAQAAVTYVTVCLCWRCTWAGMTSDPDVVLLRWAFWVCGDLILIYYWGGLHSAAPMGGGPCSAVLQPLWAANAMVCK